MDLLKHGESAYPVDAWIELQYGGGGGDANGYLGATKHEAIALSIIVLHVRSPCKREDDPPLSARISSALYVHLLAAAAASAPSQSGAPPLSHERTPRC